MPIFSSSDIHINGPTIFAETGAGSITINQLQDALGSQALYSSIAAGALHNSGERYDPPTCHPDTRMAILGDIIQWVRDRDRKFPIWWLHGAAGAGKSSIAQTIAEMCEKENLLIGSFFFARLLSGRNNARRLVTTIAYQLGLAIPATQIDIEKAVKEDHSIVDRSLAIQVERLLVRPLRRLPVFRDSDVYPQVIVIDGLDECTDTKQQREILHLLCSIVAAVPNPIAFLVASRPEIQISQEFGRGELCDKTFAFRLSATEEAYRDIEHFLWDKFQEIKGQHPLSSFIPNDWPSYDAIQLLLLKSSGYFIYPSIVMKFVSDPRHHPCRRLDIICGLVAKGNESPYAELDALYSSVILAAANTEMVLDILRVLITPHDHICHRVLDNFCAHSHDHTPNGPHSNFSQNTFLMLDLNFLEDLLSLYPGDVTLSILDLCSLIEVSKYKTIHISHLSLTDFLLDSTRSGHLYLQEEKVHEIIALHCLRNLPLQGGKRIGIQTFMQSWAVPHFALASHSEKLYQELLNFDMADLCNSPHYWLDGKPFNYNFWVSAPQFLNFIKFTRFPDDYKIMALQLQAYETFITTSLKVYFSGDQRLVDLLGMLRVCESRSHKFTDWIIHVILEDDPDLINADQEHGLQLLQFFRWNSYGLPYFPYGSDSRWSFYLKDLLFYRQPAQGYFFGPREMASLSFRLVKHAMLVQEQADSELMCKVYTHRCRLVHDYSMDLLPFFLRHSATTADLIKALTDETCPLLLASRVDIEVAIKEYLEKAGSHDMHAQI